MRLIRLFSNFIYILSMHKGPDLIADNRHIDIEKGNLVCFRSLYIEPALSEAFKEALYIISLYNIF